MPGHISFLQGTSEDVNGNKKGGRGADEKMVGENHSTTRQTMPDRQKGMGHIVNKIRQRRSEGSS
jgi:hypothetical protein